jgi:hypothetical protein
VSINNLTHVTSKSADTDAGFTLEYQLWCSRKATALLKPRSSKIDVDNFVEDHGRKERFVSNGFMLTKIKKITVEQRDSVVYNMEVDSEDHSYLVNLTAVHNCGVPYDVCSYCGNQARTRGDYCDHLKWNKLAITKEGHQIFAINDQPHFHDISRVAVPADRIAFALRKVASGAAVNLIEQETGGLWLPLAMIEKIGSARELKHAQILTKLADIEKKILLKLSPAEQNLSEAFGETAVPEETLKKLAAYQLEDVLDALNRRCVLLPPQAFVRIVLNKAAHEIKGSTGLGVAVKNMFSDITASDDHAVVSDASFVVRCPSKYAGLEELADTLVPGFSIEDEPVRHRIVATAVRGGPSLSKRASMFVEPNLSAESRYLAREYAKYQVSLLAGAGADRYIHRVVVHNQVMQ